MLYRSPFLIICGDEELDKEDAGLKDELRLDVIDVISSIAFMISSVQIRFSSAVFVEKVNFSGGCSS